MKVKQLLICIALVFSTLILITCNNGGSSACSHVYDNGTVTTAATCISKGVLTKNCTKCTATTTETIAINANAHDWKLHGEPITSATCEKDGLGEYICQLCGEDDPSHVIDATGHDHTSSLVCKNTPCDHQYAIGDTGPGDGIIFYVADGQGGRQSSITVQAGTGFAAYTAYYFEAAPENSSTSAQWGAFYTEITGITTFTSTSDAGYTLIGNGRKDTQVIVTHLGTIETGRAAQLASSANFGGKNDWFLPSLGELYQLYLQRNLTGISITSGYFWSSSQYNNVNTWSVKFEDGHRFGDGKSYGNYVRAIRAF